jgi:outer membrane protein assembly factor BamB
VISVVSKRWAGLALGSIVALSGALPAPAATFSDWAMFHEDAAHTGVSEETAIGANNAPTLSIAWQRGLGAPAYSSPVVMFNATLGKRVVYVGNQAGFVQAFDAATGVRIWSYKTGASVSSTPAVDGNVLYIGSGDHRLYALNAATGQLMCSFDTGGVVASSPVVADPDGSGRLVFVGDNGLSGSDDGGHVWGINAVDPNPAPNCTERWRYSAFGNPPGSQSAAGSWAPPAYGRDVNGRPVLVVGGSSPDNAVYGLDARDGSRIWRFQTEVFALDNDVGAGATISAPGVNGFADGVAYVTGKNAITYALNLRTGAKIWEYRIRDAFGAAAGGPRSTASLLGQRLYLGYGGGVLALDAVSGTKVWSTQEVSGRTSGVVSSPAVGGAPGDRVLLVGDMSGKLYAYSLATGQRRWTFQTGALVYASFAISGGFAFETSSDGYLYAFGAGGGSSGKPETSVAEPADGSTVANPGGALPISGTATDDLGVVDVLVAVKNKNTNKWWNASNGTWSDAYVEAAASLSSPGSTSTSWSSSFVVPAAGGQFLVQADAVDGDGQHDAIPAVSQFTVTSSGSPPETTITSPKLKQIFTFPGGTRQSFPITVTGTAVDTSGAHPGVAKVKVVVLNIDHTEYYCGSPSCGGGTFPWKPVYTVVTAVLAEPGATSTTWSLTFPTYDHPHDYRITAWAIDLDQQADQTRARVGRFCVRDLASSTCG